MDMRPRALLGREPGESLAQWRERMSARSKAARKGLWVFHYTKTESGEQIMGDGKLQRFGKGVGVFGRGIFLGQGWGEVFAGTIWAVVWVGGGGVG